MSVKSGFVPSPAYKVRPIGDPKTPEYRVFFENAEGKLVSPFSDIPLYVNKDEVICNMVVEIPRGTNAKMEIAPKEKLNPIKQDVKKGKLRSVADVLPNKGYLWNYGAFPQTWEDPTHKNEATEAFGDNDPLDVCEIGQGISYCGEVKQVKVLGALAMIDDGETDWKILAIDVNDPMAPQLNDVDDVERLMPGLMDATYQWFRTYKISAGKPENFFAFDGIFKDREYAVGVVAENYEFWRRAITKEIPAEVDGKYKLALENTTQEEYTISAEEAEALLPKSDFVPEAAKPLEADPLDVTVTHHCISEQRQVPHATSELATVVAAAATACKETFKFAQLAAAKGEDEEAVAKAAFSEFFVGQLKATQAVCLVINEQTGEVTETEYNTELFVHPYVAVVSPLLVSGGVSGSSFALYQRRRQDLHGKVAVSVKDIQNRNLFETQAAGYALYSGSLTFAYAAGLGVNVFQYDRLHDYLVLSRAHQAFPKAGNTVSIEAGEVNHVLFDAHKVLHCGGSVTANGIPLISVAGALAYMFDQANGSATGSDGQVLQATTGENLNATTSATFTSKSA